jgi:hypothetical protein
MSTIILFFVFLYAGKDARIHDNLIGSSDSTGKLYFQTKETQKYSNLTTMITQKI